MLSLQTKTGEIEEELRLKLLKVTQETGSTEGNLVLSIAVIFLKFLLAMCWTHTWKEAEQSFSSLFSLPSHEV